MTKPYPYNPYNLTLQCIDCIELSTYIFEHQIKKKIDNPTQEQYDNYLEVATIFFNHFPTHQK